MKKKRLDPGAKPEKGREGMERKKTGGGVGEEEEEKAPDRRNTKKGEQEKPSAQNLARRKQ